MNCFGSTYNLVIDDGGTTDNNYTATLTVNTTGENVAAITHISAVDFKVASTVISASLTSAPGVDANWNTVVNLGQAGNECSGAGGGFITSCDAAPSTEAPTGGVLIWTWNFSSVGPIEFGHIGV